MAQIPPKGVPQVRYYGWYSNKSRGLRRRQGEKSKGEILGPPARPKRRRRAWRELIQQVWGADPLRCPLCNGLLRRIAVVETKVEILALLTPLGLARPHERPFAVGPPRPEVTVLVDAASGAAHPIESPAGSSGLAYPQHRDDAIRFRAEVMEPGESFDQTGFELPPAPPQDPTQPELFSDDCSQADAADGEPVFWDAGAAQAFPADDRVQPDAPE